MDRTLKRRIWGFGTRWVLFTAIGLGAGLATSLGLSRPIEALVGMMLVTPAILALAGSVFGASQWLAIWKWHRAGVLWVFSSAAALAVGMTLGIVVVETAGRAITGEQVRLVSVDPTGRVLSLAVIGTLTGLAVGAAQRLALHAYGVLARSWIARCAVAFGMGLPGGALAADVFLGGLRSPAGFATFLGVTGIIVGLSTARAAERIISSPLQRAV